MKSTFLFSMLVAGTLTAYTQKNNQKVDTMENDSTSTVYLTREISPELFVDHPEPVKLEDYGILASTDPVALDQACIDIINQQKVIAKESDGRRPTLGSSKNDPTDLLNRIDQQHGVHTIEHAAKIGLGNRKYSLVSIDE